MLIIVLLAHGHDPLRVSLSAYHNIMNTLVADNKFGC